MRIGSQEQQKLTSPILFVRHADAEVLDWIVERGGVVSTRTAGWRAKKRYETYCRRGWTTERDDVLRITEKGFRARQSAMVQFARQIRKR